MCACAGDLLAGYAVITGEIEHPVFVAVCEGCTSGLPGVDWVIRILRLCNRSQHPNSGLVEQSLNPLFQTHEPFHRTRANLRNVRKVRYLGYRCERILSEEMRDLNPRYLELDELWAFCGKKQGRLTPEQKLDEKRGDQYLFFGIDPESKVIPASRSASGPRRRRSTSSASSRGR